MFYACFACGGTDVSVREWINPNTGERAPHGLTNLKPVPFRDATHTGDKYFDCNDFLSLRPKGACFSNEKRGCYMSYVEIVCLETAEEVENLQRFRTVQLAELYRSDSDF